MEFLPERYLCARDKLINNVQATSDFEEKKKLYDIYSRRFTMSSDLWKQRIALELPPQGTPITKDVLDVCLKLRRKAMKHFCGPSYFSLRLQKLCEDEKVPKLEKVYQFRCIILEDSFPPEAIKKLEPFLTFPHSQLPRFYRYYQLNSGTPLSADTKAQYDKSVESYRQMITVAMKPYEWIKWMKSNFSEEDWARNFECKLAEHCYMKEIWFAYIKVLGGRKTTDVLDVYKRYCRLFIVDVEMRNKYSMTITRYRKDGHDVNQWIMDVMDYCFDFFLRVPPNLSIHFSGKLSVFMGLEFYKVTLPLPRLCRECFEFKNQRYMKGKMDLEKLQKLSFWKLKKSDCECYLCGESLKGEENSNEGEIKEEYDNVMVAETSLSTSYNRFLVQPSSIKFHPLVKIQFHDNRGPSIPLPMFYYLLENTDHQLLAKLYATSKYFFVKKLILICYRIEVSSGPTERRPEQALFTNVKTILKSPIRKYCCGTNLSFKDQSNPNLLSKCLPKLCCCSLTNLIIFGQNLTVDEFKYLLQSGKMELVSLKEVRIFKENGRMMKVEEIIDMFPTVTELVIDTKSRQMYSRRSSQRIAALLRDGKKFELFWLCHVPDTYHIGSFKTFLREHMQLRGYFYLGFRPNINPLHRVEYRQLLKEVKNNWLPAYQGPQSEYVS